MFLLSRQDGENSEDAAGDGNPTQPSDKQGAQLPCRSCAVGLRSGQVKHCAGVKDCDAS